MPPAARAALAVGALLAAVLAGLGALPSPAAAALAEEIPTGHRIYVLLRRLEAVSGLLPLHSRTEPLTRGEVLEALRRAPEGTAARGDTAWARALRHEILEELALEAAEAGDAAGDGSAPAATLRTALRIRPEVDAGGRSRFRAALAAEAGADVTRWLVLFERFSVDTHGDRDPDFAGRRWRDALTARVDRVGVGVAAGPAALLVGRSASRWGIGEPGGLILSPTSPPLDLVRLRLDVGRFRLVSIASALDADSGDAGAEGADAAGAPDLATVPVPRRLAAHRLSVRLAPRLSAGISEAVVYGGASRDFEIGYLVPILPFYEEQWNSGDRDNVLWGIDAAWSPRAGTLLEGELLIDDFQYDLKTEPHQVGWTAGATWAPWAAGPRVLLSGEYTRMATFVYGHAIARNRYLHEGVGVGHPLGPDSDRIAGRATWDPGKRTTLDLLVARERHGAQRADTPQDPANPGGLGFPSPPVRRSFVAEASLSWRPRVTRRIEAAIGYSDGGDRRPGWSARVEAVFRLERLVRWNDEN